MSQILLYQTSDPKFADSIVDALKKRNIPYHRDGSGVNNLNANTGNWTDHQIYIYILNEKDYRQANNILIDLGAPTDKPIKLPRGWSVAVITAIFLLCAVALSMLIRN